VDTNAVLLNLFYLKQLLGYSPFESILALLPMTLVVMSSMISFTPKLKNSFGIKRNLVIGFGLAIGIIMFSLSASPNSSSSSSSSGGGGGGGDESSTSIDMLMVYVLPTSVIVVSGMSVACMSVLRAVSILKKNRRE
jgi:hypothetical protein